MQITKKFKFDAAHRLLDSYTKRCQNIHGHGYIVELTFSGHVKPDGMLIDFSYISERYKHLIDIFDHSLVVNAEDKRLLSVLSKITERYIVFPGNPTAENMAQYFYNYIYLDIKNASLPEYFLSTVKVWETPTGCATADSLTIDLDANLPKLAVSSELSYEWSVSTGNKFQRNMVVIYEGPTTSGSNMPTIADAIG